MQVPPGLLRPALAGIVPYEPGKPIEEVQRELGLERTHYADPSGLLAENMSSAYDLARLIAYAAAAGRP